MSDVFLPGWMDEIIRCPETGKSLTKSGNDYVREDGKNIRTTPD